VVFHICPKIQATWSKVRGSGKRLQILFVFSSPETASSIVHFALETPFSFDNARSAKKDMLSASSCHR
jgi:hypothetical protein